MLDIGIDFGSTYTTVAAYRQNTDTPEALSLTEQENKSIPSVVAIANGETTIGRAAKKKRLRNEDDRKFRAFKMMLAEDDQDTLQARGFDEAYTPEKVTQKFLGELIRQVLKREGADHVDHLTICCPEVWNTALETVDGRAKLREICRSFEIVNEVDDSCIKVVSEPAAASAYFAYNYRKDTEKNYEGSILLIDYGGGTLDITLTDVEPRPGPDGTLGMEIRVRYRTGVGECEENGKVGQAGIVYMETVTREAIQLQLPKTDVNTDENFFKAVDELESALLDDTATVQEIFNIYGSDPDGLTKEIMKDGGDDAVFTEIRYGRQSIPVTYKLMAKVYNEVIRKTFDEKLDEVIGYMDEKGIDYSVENSDKLKIVLVGGFGNFALVNSQVEEKFRFNYANRHVEHIIKSAQDRELAIALGASLLAAGVIRIRRTAPVSFGVAVRAPGSRHYDLSFAFHLGEDISDEEFLQRSKPMPGEKQGRPIRIVAANRNIRKFIVCAERDERKALVLEPKPEFLSKLNHITDKPLVPFVVGFSLDSSGIITMYVHEYDNIRGSIVGEPTKIELTSIKELFDVQHARGALEDEDEG